MAKKTQPNDGVINLSNARTVVATSVKKILQLKEQRAKINAQIASERAQCKEVGVPPAALDLAIRMKELDPEQRAAIDEGYLIARQAIGLAIQPDLFASLNEEVAKAGGPEIVDAQTKHVEEVKATKAKPAADTGAGKPQQEPEVVKANNAKPMTVAEAVAAAKGHLANGEGEKPNPFDDEAGTGATA